MAYEGDLDRSQMPIWTREEFDRADNAAQDQAELSHYDDDEVLLDGLSAREHRELLLGVNVTQELASV